MTPNFDPEKAKYTLITNISFVQRDGADRLRLDCHALLVVEEGMGIFGPNYTIRGFGTEAAWEVFQLWLEKDKHFPFTIEPYADPSSVILKEDGTTKPIFAGNVLALKDGTRFFLQADDDTRPLDVHKQSGDVLKVWSILESKVAEYWKMPNMPRLVYRTPEYHRMETAGYTVGGHTAMRSPAEEAIIAAGVASLTKRQIAVLRKVKAGGDLVCERGCAYVGDERTSPRLICALLQVCAVRMDSYSEVGGFERYLINETGEEILKRLEAKK